MTDSPSSDSQSLKPWQRRLGLGRSRNHFRFGMALIALIVGMFVFAQVVGSDWREALDVANEKVERGSRSKVKPGEMARTFAYWGAVASAVLAGGLVLSRRWWAGSDHPAAVGDAIECGGSNDRKKADRVSFWLMLVMALVVGLVLRVPRMTHSFYNDESHTFTRLVAGEWKNGAPGDEGAEFDRPRWDETAFSNKTGNNGFFYSIVARSAFDSWKCQTNAPDGQICEWIVRLPVLVAGVLTIVLVALGGRRLGGPWAGVAAAWLLALHPWHLRFSTEARAYGMAMMFVALGLWLLVAAWQTNRWRWWLPYGLSQFLMMFTYPGAAFLVVLSNVVLVVILSVRMFSKSGSKGACTALIRLAVSAVFATVPALMVMGVPVINTREALASGVSMQGKIPTTWWADALCFLGAGFAWHDSTPGSPLSLSVEFAKANGAWLQISALVVFGALVVIGLVTGLMKRDVRPIMWVVVAGVLSIVALYINSSASGNVLMVWYVLPVLPLLVVVAGLGVGAIARAATHGGFTAAAPAIVLALVVGWGICLARPISIYRFHPKANPREVVRDARGGDFPGFSREPMTFSLWFDGDLYDPYLVRFVASDAESVKMLDEAIVRAHDEARDLVVYVAQTGNARKSHPMLMERLTMSGEFSRGTYRYGLESPVFDNYSFKLRMTP